MFTLGILSGFVFTILISAAYFGGKIEAGMMIGLTLFFNVIMWLVSPWLTDLIQGWVYKIEKVEFADFERRFPNVARFMKDTCAKHRLKIPTLLGHVWRRCGGARGLCHSFCLGSGEIIFCKTRT